MLADAHRKAAEDIESTILSLQAQPRAARVIIEGAWGAAFQWIAFGCETKYQQHLNNHTRLGRFLRSLGEKAAADWWEALDLTRQAGGMEASRSCRRSQGLVLVGADSSVGHTMRERNTMQLELQAIPPRSDEETLRPTRHIPMSPPTNV